MASTFYGYSGLYKGYYLRSSLEYIYARYLDSLGRGWVYESMTYTLANGIRYKPDFLLETGQYVEIKGSFNFLKDLPKVQQFERDYGVTVEVLQESDLRHLIRSTPFVFEHLKQEWKTIAKVRGMSSEGAHNPMFGVSHSETTKAKISAKAKSRFQDPVFRAKFVNSSKRQAYHASRVGVPTGHLVERVSLVCAFCSQSFQCVPHIGKRANKKFCSYTCSVNAQHGKTATTDAEIRLKVLKFAEARADQLFSIKLNRLKPLFQPLYDQIAEEFDIRDIRTICQMVVGQPCNRKALLFYLQNHVEQACVENVRGTAANLEAVELGDKKPLG